MAIDLFENHGITVTETPDTVTNADSVTIIPLGAGDVPRVYEYGMPSSIDDRSDITCHTDAKFTTREPSISEEIEQFIFVTDFRADYLSLIDNVADYVFTFKVTDIEDGSVTNPTISTKLKLTNAEPNDNFVAGDGEHKKITWTLEPLTAITYSAGA